MKLTKAHKALRKWADKQPAGWRTELAYLLNCDPSKISHFTPRNADVKRIQIPSMEEALIIEKHTGVCVEDWQ
ncbi:MAG: hypothetical protein KGL39_52810 [Patescibacteria group bacterium]|nr:hypothetical protein [Patescibacteria group bacterium]